MPVSAWMFDVGGRFVEVFLMRVFVTGASGHVASAVIPELIGGGHQVVGLARSDASAAKVAALGAEVRRGDLDDLDTLRDAVSAADGVIHLAFKHDLVQVGDMVGAAEADLRAIRAIGEALAGSGKPLVATSGTALLRFQDRPGTENDTVPSGPRVDAENYVVGLAGRGVRSSVVRLAPTTHSALDRHGFVPTLINIARETGVSAYVGDGANHWSAGHTYDAARVYRLALEKAPAGSRLHPIGDGGVPFREIAEAIGEQLNVPVKSISAEEAQSHFRFLAFIVGVDNVVSNDVTRQVLGWEPAYAGLIDDLKQGHYFA